MSNLIYSSTQLYRRLHLGSEGDEQVYLRAVRGAKEILELGCGWGRLSLPLAQQGHRVTAVDLQPEFLEDLQNRAHELGISDHVVCRRQDIRELSLFANSGARCRFERIIIPYNTLYALGGLTQVARCLKRASEHLEPNGELWFDVYDMDEFHADYDPSDDEQEVDPVAQWETSHGTVSVFEHTEVLHPQMRLNVTYRAFLGPQALTVGELAMTHDYVLSEQLLTLLAEAGLEVIGHYPGSLLLNEDSDSNFYATTLIERH